jgi:hypothetical protein
MIFVKEKARLWESGQMYLMKGIDYFQKLDKSLPTLQVE